MSGGGRWAEKEMALIDGMARWWVDGFISHKHTHVLGSGVSGLVFFIAKDRADEWEWSAWGRVMPARVVVILMW